MSKQRSKALSYYLVRVNDMKLLAVINTVFGCFGFILFAAIVSWYSHLDMESMQAQFFDITPFLFISGFSGAGMLLMTYVIGVNAFSHLHNKNISDMHLSLPLNHTNRFLMNFSAGLTVIAVPYAVTATIAVLVVRIFGNMELINDLLIGGFSGVFVNYVIPGIFTGVLIFTFFYVLTVFCCTICGKGFIVSFYPFLISAVIPLTIFSLSMLSTMNTHGMKYGMHSDYAMIISSPLGLLVGNFEYLSRNSDLMIKFPIYTIPPIIFTLGLAVASFFISRRVKAENIGRDLLFKIVYNIQQFGVCFCITSLFMAIIVDSHDPGAIIFWMLTITAITFFVGDIIHNRGIKGLKRAVVKYIAVMMASFLIGSVVYASNGLWRASYIPAANDIKSVSVSSSIYGPDSFIRGTPVIRYYLNPERFEIFSESNPNGWHTRIHHIDNFANKESWQNVVNQAREIHRAVLNSPGDTWYSIWIEYELKNGMTITRNYQPVDIQKLIREGVLMYEETRNEYAQEWDYKYCEWHDDYCFNDCDYDWAIH
jgi:hypothetical protein